MFRQVVLVLLLCTITGPVAVNGLFDWLSSVAGGAIASVWKQVVPDSMNQAAIIAAGGCTDGRKRGGGLFDLAASGAGTVIGGIWGIVVPGTANNAAIQAAGGTICKVNGGDDKDGMFVVNGHHYMVFVILKGEATLDAQEAACKKQKGNMQLTSLSDESEEVQKRILAQIEKYADPKTYFVCKSD